MIINHNLSAMYAHRTLGVTNSSVTKNIEKLSSGLRINRAGDDASGLAVSEKMRAQIYGLNQASQNVSNGISFIQATEGYLQETQDILHRLRTLSVQAANGIYTDEDRMQIQVEVSQLVDEINRIASHAQFNGMNTFCPRNRTEHGDRIYVDSHRREHGSKGKTVCRHYDCGSVGRQHRRRNCFSANHRRCQQNDRHYGFRIETRQQTTRRLGCIPEPHGACCSRN